ncbi:hypothetical protein T4D_510 [Trichinella pseudospiralis]|uniref:Uncharacterized protein n=1 Tax=Trichinella pseudospiralis TaxID=6337 RepID=A0A0V1DKY6_TRIPS|nr:hypothetical protein T4D_510 [Trichinella pseudospiralis]
MLYSIAPDDDQPKAPLAAEQIQCENQGNPASY